MMASRPKKATTALLAHRTRSGVKGSLPVKYLRDTASPGLSVVGRNSAYKHSLPKTANLNHQQGTRSETNSQPPEGLSPTTSDCNGRDPRKGEPSANVVDESWLLQHSIQINAASTLQKVHTDDGAENVAPVQGWWKRH